MNFEPYGNDSVSGLSRDHGAEIFLDKDARKWATKLTKDQQVIASVQKQVKGLQSVTTAYTKVLLPSFVRVVARMMLLMLPVPVVTYSTVSTLLLACTFISICHPFSSPPHTPISPSLPPSVPP